MGRKKTNKKRDSKDSDVLGRNNWSGKGSSFHPSRRGRDQRKHKGDRGKELHLNGFEREAVGSGSNSEDAGDDARLWKERSTQFIYLCLSTRGSDLF